MRSSQLHTFLQEQLANGRALVQILESEAQALSVRDVDAIERLAAEKQRLTGTLVEQAQSMSLLLSKQDTDGKNPVVSAPDDSDALLGALWEETRSVLAAAHTLNQANGKTVELSLNHVARTLRILTTGTDTPRSHIYSASGKVDGGSNRSQRVVTA